MADFRSKSYADGRYPQQHQMQLEKSYSYAGPRSDPHDFRSYDHPGPYSGQGPDQLDHPPGQTNIEFKKRSMSTKNWILTDPELQRKKRVAGYKAYGVEGKVKGGLRNSFRWIKDRYNLVMHGWR